MDDMKRENIRVVIRVRPLNKRELNLQSVPAIEVGKARVRGEKEIWIIDKAKQAKLTEGGQYETGRCKRDYGSCKKKFTFDDVFGMEETSRDIYHVTLPVVEGLMNGYNGTILAYGQTGSGKTFTMQGSGTGSGLTGNGSGSGSGGADNSIGITQLAIDHIFNAISVDETGKFLVTASYLQNRFITKTSQICSLQNHQKNSNSKAMELVEFLSPV